MVIWMKQSIFSPILSMQPVSPSYSTSSFLSESVTATKFCLSWKCLDFRIVVLKTVLMDISALPTILILLPVEELRKGYVESSTKFILDALKQAEQSLEG